MAARGTIDIVDVSSDGMARTVKIPPAQEIAAMMTAAQAERLTEVLQGYAMKATPENVAMLQLMLENGIPLTKENILHMNHALKLTQSPDKAMFMIQNNMRLTQANANQLNGLVSGQTNITSQLLNLLSAIEQLSDSALATQLKQIIANHGAQQSQGTEAGQGQAA